MNTQIEAKHVAFIDAVTFQDIKTAILDVKASFGAPGDYGYNTREGKALFKLYSILPNVCALLDTAIELDRLREINAELLAALRQQQANIRNWLETGVPADAEESRSISDQIDAAIARAEHGAQP